MLAYFQRDRVEKFVMARIGSMKTFAISLFFVFIGLILMLHHFVMVGLVFDFNDPIGHAYLTHKTGETPVRLITGNF